MQLNPAPQETWAAIVDHQSPIYSKVGTWTQSVGAASGIGQAFNDSFAQNDEATWKVWLSGGTWSIRSFFTKESDGGIVTCQLGGSTFATFDSYAAGTTHGNASLATSIVVGATGIYNLRFLVASKNASSSGFALILNASTCFTRTA